ncbi:hypothetical protein Pmar_PMAR029711 [Perkinsus marinus ATCC 50983]|uniref:Uncharacterized protein n=1 Tax=Perkinsus marinus (strain ATCC 50983 / TXsc) TaxID=423536 RepID=C5KNT2_PERM5|nr:hypothetical protein Pmar_PMAR029711 [Perkinsus marinus ATCC 50983]EER13861.1 hypothetical protein Pmar_PMAR029711 [Perkinsus marinus ATCC 50983]|eukprot:XP_002782066.1 hypothetical protein Pmar_PMAR029711 [Perkinsus marinus ATCC 50983]
MTTSRLLLILLHCSLLVRGNFEETKELNLRYQLPPISTPPPQKALTYEGDVEVAGLTTPKAEGSNTTIYIILVVVNALLLCCIVLVAFHCFFHCFQWIGKMLCIGVSEKSRQAWLEKELQLPPITKDSGSPTATSTIVDDIEMQLDGENDF